MRSSLVSYHHNDVLGIDIHTARHCSLLSPPEQNHGCNDGRRQAAMQRRHKVLFRLSVVVLIVTGHLAII